MVDKKEYNRLYRLKNRKKRRNYMKRWKKTPQGKLYRKRYMGSYNIKYPEYQEMITRQNNLCAICLKRDEKKSLAIDHCHISGRVRGLLCHSLLCHRCNLGLGLFSDNIDSLQSAIVYLKRK